MLVKIEPPHPGLMSALAYNESKMDGVSQDELERSGYEDLKDLEDGHVIATFNVPEGSTLIDEFNRLKMVALKNNHRGPVTKNVAMHLSINPSDTDKPLTDDEAKSFISELMKEFGYGQQPYRIYKHTDIPRQHYHVVSIRVGQDGKKITDSFEHMRLRRAATKLANKYGFTITLNEFEQKMYGAQDNEAVKTKTIKPTAEKKAGRKTEKKAITANNTIVNPYVKPFKREDPKPVNEQLTEAVDDALQWYFSTFEQLQYLLLRRYNTLIEVEGDEFDQKIVVSGCSNHQIKAITKIISEKDLGKEWLKEITDKVENENMGARRDQRNRLEKLAQAAADAANTYDDFLKIMEKKGVWLFLSWKKNSDEPFGVTYLDRATKCAWKGSETAADLAWLKKTAKEKGWELHNDRFKAYLDKRNNMPSRQHAVKTKTQTVTAIGGDVLNTGRVITNAEKPFKIRLPNRSTFSDADVTKKKDRENKRDDKNKEYIGENQKQ